MNVVESSRCQLCEGQPHSLCDELGTLGRAPPEWRRRPSKCLRSPKGVIRGRSTEHVGTVLGIQVWYGVLVGVIV